MSQSGPARPKRAGRSLDVERFERVVAPGATTLLRLTGRLSSHAIVADDALTLVVDDGRAAHRVAPLPGPRALVADGRLEAAFAVGAAGGASARPAARAPPPRRPPRSPPPPPRSPPSSWRRASSAPCRSPRSARCGQPPWRR